MTKKGTVMYSGLLLLTRPQMGTCSRLLLMKKLQKGPYSRLLLMTRPRMGPCSRLLLMKNLKKGPYSRLLLMPRPRMGPLGVETTKWPVF